METVRSPERRIEDFQAILQGCQKLKGITSFGDSTISCVLGNYEIDIPSDKPGIRIYFVIDARGITQDRGRYFEEISGDEAKPLTPSEIEELKRPILGEDKVIDEVITTFKEGVEISHHDKEIAIGEETEKMVTAIRINVLDITDLTVDSCEKKSSEIRFKKPTVAPSVVDSLDEREWKEVILKVRGQIQSDDSFKRAA